jgi:hypothetical protein
VNVLIKGEAELAKGEYVSGDFFRGLAVAPAAGRLIHADDDRAGAAPVAVLSMGYSQRRFGGAANATGQPILINNVPFIVVGVAPSQFFGVDPAEAPHVYLPMHASLLFDPGDGRAYVDQNYYWVEMMGRLRPGVGLAQAQAVLVRPFAEWVASTATNERERPIFQPCASRKAQVDSTASGASTRSRSTCCGRWWPSFWRSRARIRRISCSRGPAPAHAKWRCGSASAPDDSAWCVSC